MAIKASYRDSDIHFRAGEDAVRNGVKTISDDNYGRLRYPHWAPTWDPKHEMAFNHMNANVFKHLDRGYFGDPSFSSLLAGTDSKTKVTTKIISPRLGTEVTGLQLSKLTPKQKDDLALLIEQRGVVAFREQDFKDLSFDDITTWGKHFGPLHVHPTSGAPLNQPEFHITFRRGSKEEAKKTLANRLNNIGWHSDVTYELQPPGITLFGMLQTDVGGDTQFVDTVVAYERLSPLMKEMLDGLQVLHSSKEQAQNSVSHGGIQRKEQIESIHPLVRYHPVLKKKCLFLNESFSRRILGMKQEESDNLLRFLIRHIETCLDAHIRPNWDENTIVMWDNRRVIHTATNDWDSESIRHAFRLTTIGERPIGSEEEFQDWTPELEKEKLKNLDEILDMVPSEYYDKYVAPKQQKK